LVKEKPKNKAVASKSAVSTVGGKGAVKAVSKFTKK